MINSFKQYLVEADKQVYFTFGRINPPTIGHEKLMDKLAAVAGRNPYKVFVSQSQDSRDNPLSYSDKIKFARKMFPKHARNILINKNVKTVFHALTSLYDQGFNKVNMVVGSDRLTEFEVLLNKYNGVKGSHGFYNFETIKVISAGDRDPDAKGAAGMSASKMRAAAAANDFVQFGQGLPKNVSNTNARALFNAVRKGMGLKEQSAFKNHIELKKVSETREQYIKGNLYELGDEVIIKKTGAKGKINWLGSNYVVVEMNGQTSRYWLEAVEKPSPVDVTKQRIAREKEADKKKHDRMMDRARTQHTANLNKQEKTKVPQDKDVESMPGTQPKKYFKGVSKDKKDDRQRHFEKGKKMDDSDPNAYKPAPGDDTAKTKLSKHTKAMMKKYPKLYKEKTFLDFKNSIVEGSLEDKAKASGISVSILKKVYDRGVAAWRTGHRPGTTPQQWGHARVNSFITKGKTYKTADADLARKVK